LFEVYFLSTHFLNQFKYIIMNNKSIKALALVALFSVSIAGAAVQFQPQETKEVKSTKIDKALLAKFQPPKYG
jgi:hypothetical protein